MPRQTRLISALCIASAILFTTARAGAQDPPSPRRPNIVLVVADDLGWNQVGFNGGFVKTPNLDRIARGGVTLDRFYVSPMCSPTRAGLLTGRYPIRFGMARSVVRPWMKSGLPPAERTLPEALGEAGYSQRGAFGKWHLGHLDPKWHPLSQGFTRYKGCYNGAADYFTRQRDGEADWHDDWEPVKEEGYTTDLIADAAAAFVRRHAAGAKAGRAPFFCYVAFTSPHEPLQVPRQYLEPYASLDDTPGDGKPSAKQKSAAMTACMDDGIGRILKAVEETGVARETLVWFLSDNGGLRSVANSNDPLREGKLTVYEGGVRVPSVVWWPGVIEGGRKADTPISFVDVVPTVLHLAGSRSPSPDPPVLPASAGASGSGAALDGRDVSDLLTGAPGAEPPARDLYHFHGQAGIEREQIAVMSADGWKLVVIGPDVRRPGGWQTDRHRVELFHLAQDPHETTDLAAKEPKHVAELGAKLVAFRRSEPEQFMRPVNRKPPNFRPPPQWRNSKAAAHSTGGN